MDFRITQQTQKSRSEHLSKDSCPSRCPEQLSVPRGWTQTLPPAPPCPGQPLPALHGHRALSKAIFPHTKPGSPSPERRELCEPSSGSSLAQPGQGEDLAAPVLPDRFALLAHIAAAAAGNPRGRSGARPEGFGDRLPKRSSGSGAEAGQPSTPWPGFMDEESLELPRNVGINQTAAFSSSSSLMETPTPIWGWFSFPARGGGGYRRRNSKGLALLWEEGGQGQ